MQRYCFLHNLMFPIKDGCGKCRENEIFSDNVKRIALLEKKLQELYDIVKVK